MIDVTILGTSGAAPMMKRKNVSFLIGNRLQLILVDCSGSPGELLLSLGIRLDNLRGVLLTHFHTDHIYALPSLVHNYWLDGGISEGKKIEIWGNTETIEFANRLVSLFSPENKRSAVQIKWTPLGPGDISRGFLEFEWGKLVYSPVNHGAMPTIGFRLESLDGTHCVFSSDCTIDERLEELITNRTKIIVVDCGGGVSSKVGHAGGEQIGNLLAKYSHIEKAYLVHLPQEQVASAQEIAEAVRGKYSGEIIVPSDLESFKF